MSEEKPKTDWSQADKFLSQADVEKRKKSEEYIVAQQKKLDEGWKAVVVEEDPEIVEETIAEQKAELEGLYETPLEDQVGTEALKKEIKKQKPKTIEEMKAEMSKRLEGSKEIIARQEYEKVKRMMVEWRKKYPTVKSEEELKKEDEDLRRKFGLN